MQTTYWAVNLLKNNMVMANPKKQLIPDIQPTWDHRSDNDNLWEVSLPFKANFVW